MSDKKRDDGLNNDEYKKVLASGKGPMVARFALALLSGTVPFVGGIFSGASGAWSDAEQSSFKKILASWLKMQEEEIKEIGKTLQEVLDRLDFNDQVVFARLESPEYLSIIKKCFRDWSAAESEEKRKLIRNLLVTAAALRICDDDIVKMFIQWIDKYQEPHFKIIRSLYNNPGATRNEIWSEIHGVDVREDSLEADLFKLLVMDLSFGHLMRQHREKDYQGNFLKANRSRGQRSGTMTSAFDDEKQYELTELGYQFVRYTMQDAVPKITAGAAAEASTNASNSVTVG